MEYKIIEFILTQNKVGKYEFYMKDIVNYFLPSFYFNHQGNHIALNVEEA